MLAEVHIMNENELINEPINEPINERKGIDNYRNSVIVG